MSFSITDRTAHAARIAETRNGRRIISRHGRHRDPSGINSIILHQTDFLSESVERMDYVIANYVVMRNGTVLKIRNHDVLLNSVGARHSLNIEFVGRYPSDRSIRLGQVHVLPTLPQIFAGRDLIRHLIGETSTIQKIHGHRQFNPTNKPNCPGPHLWYNVAEWSIRFLALSSESSEPGRIPPSWREHNLDLVWQGPPPLRTISP